MSDKYEISSQIGHHLPALAEMLEYTEKQLLIIFDGNNAQEKMDIIRRIRRVSSELRALPQLLRDEQNILSKHSFDWIEFCRNFLENKIGLSTMEVSIMVDPELKTMWNNVCNPTELHMMLQNLWKNAQEHNATKFSISFSEEILICSNSGNIASDCLETVFNLGFSTKPNGTGIGLAQTKIFLNRIGLSISVANTIDGVCFKISKNT
jgi:signal transduction histidine kinase